MALYLVVLAGLGLRLSAALHTGEPFSTDVWPLMKASEKLVEDPGVRIWDDRALGGRHNRWPGALLAASMSSTASGLSVGHVYSVQLLIPVIVSCSALGYSTLRRAGRGPRASLTALAYLLTAPSFLVFTSSVLKEVYAYPLAFTVLYMSARAAAGGAGPPDVAVVAVASLGLSASHPLASLAVSGFLAGGYAAARLMGLLRARDPCASQRPGIGWMALYGLLAGSASAGYNVLYGAPGLGISLGAEDVAVFAIYAVFTYLGYAVYRKISRAGVLEASAALAALSSPVLARGAALAPGVAVPGVEVMPYLLPASLPLALALGRPGCCPASLLSLGAMLWTAHTSLYVLLARPDLSSVFHRVANYIVLSGFFAVAVAAEGGRLLRILALAFAAISAISGAFTAHSLAAGLDGVSFYWVYRESDVAGFSQVLLLTPPDRAVAGDAKVSYYGLYAGRGVDQGLVLRLLKGVRAEGAVVVIHRDNLERGYALGSSVYSLDGLLKALAGLDRVYDNGRVFAFA